MTMRERLESTRTYVTARLRNLSDERNVNQFGLVLLFVVFFCGVIQAVTSNADAADISTKHGQRVAGVVKDALGRPLPGAQLILQTGDGRIVGRTRSARNGAFAFQNVPKGTYAVLTNKSGYHTAASIVSVTPAGPANLNIALESEAALSLQIVTTKLNEQPNGVTKTGNSQYSLTQHEIAALPQGENTSINEVLLQMPGVVQDDESQVHIDGEHEDLQWRVNGVMMPMDSFTGFGQIFNSFFIRRVSLLDGILPVTYGYRDAGVLDLVTKDGCSNPGEPGVLRRAEGDSTTELRIWWM